MVYNINKYIHSNQLDIKLNNKLNYTERNSYIIDEGFDTSELANVDLMANKRSSMLSRKTRNNSRRIANFKNHTNKHQNIVNNSISTITNVFSLSNDDTFKSEGMNKIK